MNSEELELSLRTEFEGYLKDVLNGMRQDVADFQKNFEAEFEKHRSQMDEGIRQLSTRFESDLKFDKAFTESVIEHLRLARDDGAQLTAHAFGEAQKLDQSSAPAARYDQLRDAIRGISAQTTQSAILKTLVDHVSSFTARGAFFIVKNDSFVCWRRFDRGQNAGDDSVREIRFPVSAETLLADSVSSADTKENSSGPRKGDLVYLEALSFGRPERMYAVPLMARGRAVAVLYVDSAYDEPVSLEAIESLVRVAGLTVELRAAGTTASQPSVTEAPAYVPMKKEEVPSRAETVPKPPERAAPASEPDEAPQFEYVGEVAVEEYAEESAAPAMNVVAPVGIAEAAADEVTPTYALEPAPEPEAVEAVNDFAFTPRDSYEMPVVENVTEAAVEDYSYAPATNGVGNGHSHEAAPEPVVEVATTQKAKTRLSDRHVDLPIEVSESERRQHNDARRFARLLVSEIKLYNEQKVNDGRESSDLYDRLREAIERSREMYDKRVQPQVAAKFDYFHYELVSNLAEGNDSKLGSSYPGARV